MPDAARRRLLRDVAAIIRHAANAVASGVVGCHRISSMSGEQPKQVQKERRA